MGRTARSEVVACGQEHTLDVAQAVSAAMLYVRLVRKGLQFPEEAVQPASFFLGKNKCFHGAPLLFFDCLRSFGERCYPSRSNFNYSTFQTKKQAPPQNTFAVQQKTLHLQRDGATGSDCSVRERSFFPYDGDEIRKDDRIIRVRELHL